MIALLLRLNNRWPRLVGGLLVVMSGEVFYLATTKLHELAAPILGPLAARRQRPRTD